MWVAEERPSPCSLKPKDSAAVSAGPKERCSAAVTSAFAMVSNAALKSCNGLREGFSVVIASHVNKFCGFSVDVLRLCTLDKWLSRMNSPMRSVDRSSRFCRKREAALSPPIDIYLSAPLWKGCSALPSLRPPIEPAFSAPHPSGACSCPATPGPTCVQA